MGFESTAEKLVRFHGRRRNFSPGEYPPVRVTMMAGSTGPGKPRIPRVTITMNKDTLRSMGARLGESADLLYDPRSNRARVKVVPEGGWKIQKIGGGRIIPGHEYNCQFSLTHKKEYSFDFIPGTVSRDGADVLIDPRGGWVEFTWPTAAEIRAATQHNGDHEST